MRVLITGGTGLIGRRLIVKLKAAQHELCVLTRDPDRASDLKEDCMLIAGNPTEAGRWLEEIPNCHAVVHLAGENLFAERWSPSFLDRVRFSRVHSTSLIAQKLAEQPQHADGSTKVLINGSATGIYGERGDEQLTERSSPGQDPLAQITIDWEAATQPAQAVGVRVVCCRTGIVLDERGGALPQLARPFWWGVGGRVSSGQQWLSWIHHEDLTGILAYALITPEVSGPVNAVAPHPVRNATFTQILARVIGRPNWLPVPRLAIRLLLGKVVQVVAGSQRVLPEQIQSFGYTFKFPDLEPALRDLFARPEAA